MSLKALKKDKSALAAALGDIEKAFNGSAPLPPLLASAYRSPAAAASHVVGFTGPPGVGKSTLIGALLPRLRRRNGRVAVVAVDPSSPLSHGSLLGDRLRFDLDPSDPHIFARSVASGDSGIAPTVLPFVCLLRSLFETVIVETVGVGQSEGQIRNLADTMVLCLQPAAGDGIQYMKAGIMELPDIFCINKADLPQAAAAETALMASGPEGKPAVAVSATTGRGLEKLIDELEERFRKLKNENRLLAARRRGEKLWLEEMVREKFGSAGLRDNTSVLNSSRHETPFAAWRSLSR